MCRCAQRPWRTATGSTWARASKLTWPAHSARRWGMPPNLQPLHNFHFVLRPLLYISFVPAFVCMGPHAGYSACSSLGGASAQTSAQTMLPWQVAVAALGALEAVPAGRLQALLADGALGARVVACLSSSSKEVRAWAPPGCSPSCRAGCGAPRRQGVRGSAGLQQSHVRRQWLEPAWQRSSCCTEGRFPSARSQQACRMLALALCR